MNDDNDFNVEDILNNLNKKEKKKNTSKKKGNRGENELADVLCERFPGKQFFRVVGSGARGFQVTLSEEMKNAFVGDIVCPSNFKFCVECKYGYADIDLCSFFPDGHKKIDEWLQKVQRDANNLGKQPILCWRKPRQPWLAFCQIAPFGLGMRMEYKGWSIVSFDKLLELTDEFWFNHKC